VTPDQEQQARRIRLRAICKHLGPGGQSKLARMLRWDSSMIRRRLSGETKISYADELAFAKAVEMAEKV
jgi:hypothetical protein